MADETKTAEPPKRDLKPLNIKDSGDDVGLPTQEGKQSVDEFLAGLDDGLGGDEGKAEDAPDEKLGETLAKAEREETDAPKAEKDTKPELSKEDREAHEAARKALDLAGFPKDLVEGMSPERLQVEHAKVQVREQQRQKTLDERAQQIKELEERLAQATENGGVRAEPTSESDLDAAFQPHLEALAEEFGEDGARRIEGLVREVAKAVDRPPAIDPDQAVAQGTLLNDLLMERQARAIGEMYPDQMAVDGALEALHEDAEALLLTNRFKGLSGIDRAWKTVALARFGPPAKPGASPEDTSKQRDLGQPSPTSQREQGAPLTPDEEMDKILIASEKKRGVP